MSYGIRVNLVWSGTDCKAESTRAIFCGKCAYLHECMAQQMMCVIVMFNRCYKITEILRAL